MAIHRPQVTARALRHGQRDGLEAEMVESGSPFLMSYHDVILLQGRAADRAARELMKDKGCREEKCAILVRISSKQCNTSDTVHHRHEQAQRPAGGISKMRIIMKWPGGPVSAIRLKRTDTTIDLSHMAKRAGEEKERSREQESKGRAKLYMRAKTCCCLLEESYHGRDG